MKRMVGWMVIVLCAANFMGAGAGLQTISIDEQMKIDPIGDAGINIKFTLTAAQWINWNQKYGQNKSLLVRDMGKLVSQYDTYDWDVQTKEIEREVNLSVKAHGSVNHKGNGLYEFDVPKSWKGGQHNGTTIDYNYVESLGSGSIAQYNCKLILPDSAKDIKDDTGEAGEKVVRYTVPGKSTSHWVLGTVGSVLGVLAMLGGLGIMALGLIVGGKRKPAPARGIITASPGAPAISAAPAEEDSGAGSA